MNSQSEQYWNEVYVVIRKDAPYLGPVYENADKQACENWIAQRAELYSSTFLYEVEGPVIR